MQSFLRGFCSYFRFKLHSSLGQDNKITNVVHFILLTAIVCGEMSSKRRLCVIGAGPSGMSALYHFSKLKKEGIDIPEVVCYEKQSNCGGLWNYNWRTGISISNIDT